MITPKNQTLSQSIFDKIKVEDILYAEIASPGAMGNVGGIMLYIIQENSNELYCYETNIFEDEELYFLVSEKLKKHVHKGTLDQPKDDFYFIICGGGMGNMVYLNKNVELSIQNDFFVYSKNNLDFQISPSVLGVFKNVVRYLEKSRYDI